MYGKNLVRLSAVFILSGMFLAVSGRFHTYAQTESASGSAVVTTESPTVTPVPTSVQEVNPTPTVQVKDAATPTPEPTLDPERIVTIAPISSASSQLQTVPEVTDFIVEETAKAVFDSAGLGTQQSAKIKLTPILRKFARRNFRSSEKVELAIDNAGSDSVRILVHKSSGEQVYPRVSVISRTDPFIVRLLPPRQFKPGKYQVTVVDLSGQEYSRQDFTWGVLAVNPDKSVYRTGDTARMSIAVLSESGEMVCDAAVSLAVRSAGGEYLDELSTENGRIIVNPECSLKQYTEIPDYETSYTAKSPGIHLLELTATTESGTYSVTDSFEVRDRLPYDLARSSATRIYPRETYPVEFTFIPEADFQGTVTEDVPLSFDIAELAGSLKYSGIEELQVASESGETRDPMTDVLGALSLPYRGQHPVALSFGQDPEDPEILQKYNKYGVVSHDGADFDMPVGTNVLAVDDGEVVRARVNDDYGTTIVLEHAWGKSYYGHLSTMVVAEGEHVTKGSVIAVSGNSGLTTAPHLHFGLKPSHNNPHNGYFGKVDPLPYLGLSGLGEEALQVNYSGSEQSFKRITWQVSAKAGESIRFGYRYRAPLVSPMLYTLGPAIITGSSGVEVFRESRRFQIAADAVSNGGTIVYGDTANGNPDDMDFRTYTESTGTGGETTTVNTADTNIITWVKIVSAPTREEKIAVHLKATGRMDILRCTSGCDGTADWSHIGYYATTTTDARAEFVRAFDIAYEQLSGRFMIVHADDNDLGDVYYCLWDGTNWSPATECNNSGNRPAAFAPGAGNQIDMDASSVAAQPEWVRLVPRGERLTAYRNNEMLLGVADDADDMFLAHWTGSAWDGVANPVDTLTGNDNQKFDIAWEETTGYGLAVFTDTADALQRFAIYTPGSGWGGLDTTTGPSNPATAPWNGWQVLASDPTSDDIAHIANFTGTVDADVAVWTGAAWTNGTVGLTDQETATGRNVDTVFTRFSGRAIFLNVGGNDTNFNAHCWTAAGGFTALLTAAGNPNVAAADDIDDMHFAGSPNADRILGTFRGAENVAGTGDDVRAMTYVDGTCADADFYAMTTVPLLANSNEGGTLTNTARLAHAVAYTQYSPWSLNWRFFDDETTDDPQYGVNGVSENEPPKNVDPEEFVRLRINIAERSGQGQGDTRKKLQYTSGCNPNTSETDCTWTDVGDTAETTAVWRYATSGETCTACTDGNTSATSRLTGTDETTPVFYVSDKDAAADADFDHTALKVKEIDFPLKAEAVVNATTYYFRVYEPRLSSNGQDSPVFREQDNDGANDCATSTCTYPSLTISPNVGIVMRHGGWFNGNVEQPFSF